MIKQRNSRGYSVMEILVVIAIIGVLSLVTVPAFMNFQRRNAVRAGLRSFTADIRASRQYAITKNAMVRIQFHGGREYRIWQSTDNGTSWQAAPVGAGGENATHIRTLPEAMVFSANTYDDSDTTADGRPDIDFRYDGTVGDFKNGEVTNGTVTLKTNWKDIKNTVLVQVSNTGQIKTTESTAP